MDLLVLCRFSVAPRKRGKLLVQRKLTMLERERSIVGVNAEQDALVADVFFGNEADARAHKGHPANGFLGHRSMAQFLLWRRVVQVAGRLGGTPTPQDKL